MIARVLVPPGGIESPGNGAVQVAHDEGFISGSTAGCDCLVIGGANRSARQGAQGNRRRHTQHKDCTPQVADGGGGVVVELDRQADGAHVGPADGRILFLDRRVAGRSDLHPARAVVIGDRLPLAVVAVIGENGVIELLRGDLGGERDAGGCRRGWVDSRGLHVECRLRHLASGVAVGVLRVISDRKVGRSAEIRACCNAAGDLLVVG